MNEAGHEQPNYRWVWLTFVRNALIREMTFRGNFLITVMTRALWFCSQILLFKIIFHNVQHITPGWNEYQYFAFMATGMLINALVEALFMPNMANFSELIRTGNLDFALLKPIDTQFLISFEKMDLAMLNQILLSVGLLIYAGTGIVGMLKGGNFLEYGVLAHEPQHGQHLGILIVELGVGITVAAVMITVFFAFAGRERTE